ncbi:MAG: hypothetical protein AB1589_27100 [Cyanobacteriota bacterium]
MTQTNEFYLSKLALRLYTSSAGLHPAVSRLANRYVLLTRRKLVRSLYCFFS